MQQGKVAERVSREEICMTWKRREVSLKIFTVKLAPMENPGILCLAKTVSATLLSIFRYPYATDWRTKTDC